MQEGLGNGGASALLFCNSSDGASSCPSAPEEENEEQETSGHDVQKPGQTEKTSERPETGEKAANAPIPYPVEMSGLDIYPDFKPNATTIAAMAETDEMIRTGSGQHFEGSTEELFSQILEE